jgi:hypothetical protein
MADLNLEELADELNLSPEGLQRLLDVMEHRVKAKFPDIAAKHARDAATRRQEEQGLRNARVTEALDLVSETIPGMHPEHGDDDLQRRVSKELESDEDLRYIVAKLDDPRAIAGVLRLAAKRVLSAEPNKQKRAPAPAAKGGEEREQRGPMTIQRSIRDAKASYAAGNVSV